MCLRPPTACHALRCAVVQSAGGSTRLQAARKGEKKKDPPNNKKWRLLEGRRVQACRRIPGLLKPGGVGTKSGMVVEKEYVIVLMSGRGNVLDGGDR
jgi:hypothetical protein